MNISDDPGLKEINTEGREHTDAEIARLIHSNQNSETEVPLPQLTESAKQYLSHLEEGMMPTIWSPVLVQLFKDNGIEVTTVSEGERSTFEVATLRLVDSTGKHIEFEATPKEAIDILRANLEVEDSVSEGQSKELTPENTSISQELPQEVVHIPDAVEFTPPTPVSEGQVAPAQGIDFTEISVQKEADSSSGEVQPMPTSELESLPQEKSDPLQAESSPKEQIQQPENDPVSESSQESTTNLVSPEIDQTFQSPQAPEHQDGIPVLNEEVTLRGDELPVITDHIDLPPNTDVSDASTGAERFARVEELDNHLRALGELKQHSATEQHPEIEEKISAAKHERTKLLRRLIEDEQEGEEDDNDHEIIEALKKLPEKMKGEELLYRYEEQFGITKTELEQVPAFLGLSYGQKAMVFENLAQITLGRIQEDAQNLHKEEYKNARQQSGIFGKLWLGFKETFIAKKDITEKEQDIALKLRTGGIAVHMDVLTQLVDGMAKNGPSVIERPDGELQVNFMETWEGMDAQAEASLEHFNEVAHRFSKLSRDALFPGASKKQQKEFELAEREYHDARTQMHSEMYRSKIDKGMIWQRVIEADKKVQTNQFIQTSPNAISELAAIEDKNVWKEAIKHVVTNQGFYSGLGAAGRTVAAGALGVLAAPVVASAIAGLRGWTRSGAELRERDYLARHGVKDESKESMNVVDAGGKNGMITKMDRLLKGIEELERAIERVQDKEDEQSAPALHTLEALKEKKLESLRARVSYVEDKLRLGKMNYGTKSEQLKHNYELLDRLAKAKILTEEVESNKKVFDRLEVFLERREEQIGKARKSYRWGQVRRGALVGAGFALLGVMVRDWFIEGDPLKGVIRDVGAAAKTVVAEVNEKMTKGMTWLRDTIEGPPVAHVSPLPPVEDVVAPHVFQAPEAVLHPGDTEWAEGFTPKIEAPVQYIAKPNETLSGMIRTYVGEINRLGQHSRLQENALANFIRSLSKEEKMAIGLSEHDLLENRIIAGKSYNLKLLAELYDAKTKQHGISFAEESLRKYGNSEPIDVRPAAKPPVSSGVLHERVPASPLEQNEQLQGMIERQGKIDLIYEHTTKGIFDKEPDLWKKVSTLKAEDFVNDQQMDTETKLARSVVELQLKMKSLIKSGYAPKVGENVEQFMKRVTTDIFDKNPGLQKLSMKELTDTFLEQKKITEGVSGVTN